MSEMEVEGKDKKEKDKDKWKEKVLLKSNSWAEVRKSGLTLDDIIHLRRRDNSERPVKIRYSIFVKILKVKFEILYIYVYIKNVCVQCVSEQRKIIHVILNRC